MPKNNKRPLSFFSKANSPAGEEVEKTTDDDSSATCSDSKRVRLSSEAESLQEQNETLPSSKNTQDYIFIDLMKTSLDDSSKKILHRICRFGGLYNNMVPKNVVLRLSDGTKFMLSNTIIRRPARIKPGEFRYQIVGEQLAAGGFGQVYASDSSIKLSKECCSVEIKQKPRIIKIQSHCVSDVDKAMLVDREIDILRKLTNNLPIQKFEFPIYYSNTKTLYIYPRFASHEFINSVAALGVSRFGLNKQHNIRTRCIFMPKYPGDSLKDYLQNNTLDKTEALLITYNILRELKKIHSKDVVHLDIKPANIIYDPVSKKINIIDFGIAMNKNSLLQESNGTPMYMAPEVANVSQTMYFANPATDIYSVGLVITQLLTGHNVSKKTLTLLHEMCLDNAFARPNLDTIITCFKKELKNTGVKLEAMTDNECKEEPRRHSPFHKLLRP